jgi:serine/threonine-protein kinase
MPAPLGPFVVPRDVSITAVEHLPGKVRRAAGAAPGDFAIMRPQSRTASKIIDATAASLLASFRKPQSIADGILEFSRQRRLDPESTLIAAFPLLSELVRAGFLVPADALADHPIAPSLFPGALVDGFEVISCLSAMEDTELYQVERPGGQTGALKIASSSESAAAGAMLEHEAKLLRRLNGRPAPRLLTTGRLGGRLFLITEWCSGAPAAVVAEELRSSRRGPDRPALLRLAGTIVDAYSTLHAHNVIHGDVHPHNLLVDVAGGVTILDFGLARLASRGGDASGIPRGGVAEYLEPEYARAVRAQRSPPPASRLSDQYGVAALVYRLFTGSSYLDFSLQEDEVHRQIADDPPRTFARCGVPAWPDIEAALARALSKNPASRYRSMTEFSEQLARARVPTHRPAPRRSARVLDRLRARVRSRIGVEGPLLRVGLETAPFASVNLGAAGLAWAAYRFACIEGRPEWLALAEVWLQRTRELLDHPEAFCNVAAGLTPNLVGRRSLYHSRCGVYCVEAAVAGALGDVRRQDQAMRGFVAASEAACDKVELTLGTAGTLLGCALLLDAACGRGSEPVTLIRALGDRTMLELLAWLERAGPVASSTQLRNLGIAHGWAGTLYAVLRWCESTVCTPPPPVEARLLELADCAEPSGRGVRWPWLESPAEQPAGVSMPGWCNGASGFVHLWTTAHRLLNEERFAHLAELAAWEAWEHPSDLGGLCCGLAGRGYALINLFRRTGETAWLHRAWQLAERSARQTPPVGDPEFPDSLYRGEVGLALLAADLESPRDAFMPFFESEGWPRVPEVPT